MSLCEPGLEMAAAAAADPMEKEEEEEVNCRAGEEVKLAARTRARFRLPGLRMSCEWAIT